MVWLVADALLLAEPVCPEKNRGNRLPKSFNYAMLIDRNRRRVEEKKVTAESYSWNLFCIVRVDIYMGQRHITSTKSRLGGCQGELLSHKRLTMLSCK